MTSAPDVTWVQEIVRRKSGCAQAEASLADRDNSIAFSVLRTELWQELVAAVGAYNVAVGREALMVALQAEGRIGIGKDGYPSGYLDILPDRDTGKVVVTFSMQKSATAPIERRIIESSCVVRDGVARIQWEGRDLSVQEEVRRILTPFFEEI